MKKEEELEKLLAFNTLTIDMSEEKKIEFATKFGINYEEFKKRMVGKEKEADFIAILKSLGVLKHFEAYDEGLSHITKEYTPDFKIELTDGYQMFLEVKHTDKEKFQISITNLEKRMAFAERNNKLPLRFAISIKGIWGLFTSEYLKEKKGKLEIGDFCGENSCSWLDRELDKCSYMFPEGIKIKSVYSIDHPKAIEIEFQPYGKLVSYELYYRNKRIFRMKGKESPYIPHVFCLEELQNNLSKNQKIKKEGKYTIITEFSNSIEFIPEYKFLLAPIKHMKKEIGEETILYDSKMAIQDKKFIFLSVQILRIIIDDLVKKGLDIIVFRDDKGYRFTDYKENFWTKSYR